MAIPEYGFEFTQAHHAQLEALTERIAGERAELERILGRSLTPEEIQTIAREIDKQVNRREAPSVHRAHRAINQ